MQCRPVVLLYSATSILNLGLVNARSIRNKTDLLIDHVIDADIDLLAITETWLSPEESEDKTIKDVTTDGYKFEHVPRKNRRGGAIGFLYRSKFIMLLTIIIKRRARFNSWPSVSHHPTDTSNMSLFIPSSIKNKLTFADSLREFSQLIEHYAMSSSRFAILGDFNTHFSHGPRTIDGPL